MSKNNAWTMLKTPELNKCLVPITIFCFKHWLKITIGNFDKSPVFSFKYFNITSIVFEHLLGNAYVCVHDCVNVVLSMNYTQILWVRLPVFRKGYCKNFMFEFLYFHHFSYENQIPLFFGTKWQIGRKWTHLFQIFYKIDFPIH